MASYRRKRLADYIKICDCFRRNVACFHLKHFFLLSNDTCPLIKVVELIETHLTVVRSSKSAQWMASYRRKTIGRLYKKSVTEITYENCYRRNVACFYLKLFFLTKPYK